ncbi:MAG: DNA replication and repair protein RecF [Deltaproteobacteria bacterium]|nr:MAG: DNA replication and repair protein RecF [Deltaproteobacteria bacterium]
MFLKDLQIERFRIYENARLERAGAFNLICGDNAQGKTSVLEALYCLGTTKSFKTSTNRDIIRSGAEETGIHGTLVQGTWREKEEGAMTRSLSLSIRVTPEGGLRKRVGINGKEAELLDYFSWIKVSSLTAEDDAVLLGGPEVRRRFLDRAIFNIHPRYLQTVREYTHLLREKRALLKEPHPNRRMIETWNRRLTSPGSRILSARRRWLQRVAGRVRDYYRAISGTKGEVTLVYHSCIEDPPGQTMEEENCRNALHRKLEAALAEEIATRQTLIGPHRDEIEIRLDHRPARRHASRGELKTLLLALKLSEIDEILEATGEEPILLVDEIGREFDRHRIRFLLDLLGKRHCQVFLTTPDLARIPIDHLPEVRTFQVRQGRIEVL